jgi:hypothetical protein
MDDDDAYCACVCVCGFFVLVIINTKMLLTIIVFTGVFFNLIFRKKDKKILLILDG